MEPLNQKTFFTDFEEFYFAIYAHLKMTQKSKVKFIYHTNYPQIWTNTFCQAYMTLLLFKKKDSILFSVSRNHDHIRHMSVTQTYLSRNTQALNIAERCGITEVHVYSRFF